MIIKKIKLYNFYNIINYPLIQILWLISLNIKKIKLNFINDLLSFFIDFLYLLFIT